MDHCIRWHFGAELFQVPVHCRAGPANGFGSFGRGRAVGKKLPHCPKFRFDGFLSGRLPSELHASGLGCHRPGPHPLGNEFAFVLGQAREQNKLKSAVR